MKDKRFFICFKVFTFYFLLFTFIGCDAFVRKFTRKPKKGNLPKEEMVLAPEEYKGLGMTKEELYRQSFMFWKSWHTELIESIIQKKSIKKQLDCAQEAIKNLLELRKLLNSEKQAKLDVYINQLTEFKGDVAKDLYIGNSSYALNTAERIKRNILRDFSYNKASKDIIQ